MDIRRVAYYRQRERHLQKHQAEPHTQAYSQKIRIADGGLWVMDDRHSCNSQRMWPPRKGMEQTECHATCHTKQSYRMLDYPTDRLHAHLFWSLHHQILPQYHISGKWHAGQDAGTLRRISRSWPRRTGLPIRQLAGWAIVEHPITKTGTIEKKKRWGGLYPPHQRASEIIFAVKRRKDLPPHQPIPFASLDFIPLVYIQTIK